jgi:thiol-disulfide isomerase/thioredoxin
MKTKMYVLWKPGFLVALIFAATLFSCTKKSKPEDVAVVGDMGKDSYYEGKMLYLENVEVQNFVDSCVVKNGKFAFSVKADSNFVPFLASIVSRTSDPVSPRLVIGLKNPLLDHAVEGSFYVDRGTTSLVKNKSAKLVGREKIQLTFEKLNKQAEAAYMHSEFKTGGSLTEKDFAFNKSLVKKYSYSIELLKILNWSKQGLPDQEISELLNLFDRQIRSTTEYKNLLAFVSYGKTSGTTFPTDVSLKRPDSSMASNVVNRNRKYKLIVFWASWCGPCRQEIPQIKSLYSKHKGALQITSISTDRSEPAWRNALNKEQMPWDQLLVNDTDSFVKLDKKYNLQAIPVWVLFDQNNKLIHKQIGMSVG